MDLKMTANEPLAKHCTFGIGGPARRFIFAENEKEIIDALQVAKASNEPVFILGGGSNVLFSDKGFSGAIICLRNDFIRAENNNEKTKLVVGAGVSLSKLINYCLDNSLVGMEWAAGIPGTIGGALHGNAGAFGDAIGNYVVDVKALNISSRGILPMVFSRKDCVFDYRDSIFKHNKNLIIISAILQFAAGARQDIENRTREYLQKKAVSQPLDKPSAGSIFVNPPGYFAAKLIEDCGLKGKIIGGAQISSKHANFIVNLGNAKSDDVLALINLAKQSVKEKFNINLREEIEIIKP